MIDKMITECNCTNILNATPINSPIIELHDYSVERGQTTAVFKDPTNKIGNGINCNDARPLDPEQGCPQAGYIIVPSMKVCDDCPDIPLTVCADDEERENGGRRVTEIWKITSAIHDDTRDTTTVTFYRLTGRRIAGECRIDKDNMGGSKYQHFQDELFLFNPTTDNPYAFSDIIECLHHLREESRCIVTYQEELNDKNQFFHGERCIVLDSLHNGCFYPRMFVYDPTYEGNSYAPHWRVLGNECNVKTEHNFSQATTPLHGDRIFVETCNGYREYLYDTLKTNNYVGGLDLGKWWPIDKVNCFEPDINLVSPTRPDFSYDGDMLITRPCPQVSRAFIWNHDFDNEHPTLSHWQLLSGICVYDSPEGVANFPLPQEGDKAVVIDKNCGGCSYLMVYSKGDWVDVICPQNAFVVGAGEQLVEGRPLNPTGSISDRWTREWYDLDFGNFAPPRNARRGMKWIAEINIANFHWVGASSDPTASGAKCPLSGMRFGARTLINGEEKNCIDGNDREQTHNYGYGMECDGDNNFIGAYDVGNGQIQVSVRVECHMGADISSQMTAIGLPLNTGAKAVAYSMGASVIVKFIETSDCG